MKNSIKDVEIRQASQADVTLFYPDGIPHTIYAWLATYKGEPACIAGISLSRAGCCAFSDVKPNINASKRTVMLTAAALLDHIKQLGLPIYTACDSRDKMAQKFVRWLGFVHDRQHREWELFLCQR